MNKTKVKAGCGIGLVFAAGFLAGAISLFALIIYIIPRADGWRDEESKDFVTRHLTKRLDLTEEQAAQARVLIHDSLDRRYALRRDYLLDDQALIEKGYETLRPGLTPEQQEKAERMLKRWTSEKQRLLLPGKSSEPPEAGTAPAP